MDSFETDVNRNTTNELDINDDEELLEKMDDYQFATFVENCCVKLQHSHDILDEDCIKQASENSLMWEKSFEHTILLDMDDDFNLNFNEVCDSYTIFLSQSSAEDDSLNITTDDVDKIENEYDGSDEDEIYSTEETKYEQNQHICSSSYSDQNDERQENSENSFQENKLQDLQDNTTDEEQEELPYDGNLQNVSEHPTDEHPDLVDHMLPLTRLVRNQSVPLPVSRVSENSVSNQNQMFQSGLLSSSCQVINSAGSQQHETQSGSASHSIIFSPSVISAGTKPDSCQPFAEVHKATEAEQMAQELNEQIEYFKYQVEDFQKCLNSESVSLEDVQWEFKKLRDGQEKLERRYIATKDEHRSLQQRRYLDKSIIVGEFDPDRVMDGEIFRTGMQLENIKEKIDEYICIQASPSNSIMATPHSTNHSLSSENTMAAVIQEGLGVVLVTQDSFQKEVMPEETPKRNGKLSVPEDRDNPIQQRDLIKYSKLPTEGVDFSVPEEKLVSNFLMPLASIPTIDDQSCRRISEMVVNVNENQLEQDPQSLELQTPTVSTKAPSTLLDNNFHASVYPSNSFMNQSLILHSISVHEQEPSNELKIILPDNGIAGSESCRPHTAIHTLDSGQPQTERYSNVCENMHSCKRGLHNGSDESTHTTENIMENDNKVRQLLQLADPSGCTNPLKWHEPIIGVTDFSAAAGNCSPDLDLLTESSEDHIPLPIPQQCKSKTLLQQANCGKKENEDLSQSWSTKNEEVLELQNEVSKLKRSLEENLSKLSNVSPSQRQRYRTRSCHSEKFSSTRCEDNVKLTTNFLNSLKRRSCSWLRGDEGASNPKLNNRMEDLFFSDTQISVYAKQDFLEKPRTSHHKRSYSEGHKSSRTWLKGSYKGLHSSTNGLNLHRPKMNSCFLCKILSEGSSGQSRHGLTSSLGISATAPNKYSEIFASISPLRYDTIEYPPISNGSRIYYSPTCEIDNVRSPVLPNQFCSTKSLLRGNIEKSNINAQEILHLNTTLDRAIETANSMKKTTRRMIKILSADLAKAEYYKYLYDF
ncbi:hypothetical protein chiPu_0010465 [Chiloscyllium punctatum]|uniref:AKNA domain-containing protein n=1 Tax=Chiloscyllium punctatum TaxID=137246 RepID=A0A401SNN0_CHIPU|nr:hypothetical protein [Chiloscyllium punctatum]